MITISRTRLTHTAAISMHVSASRTRRICAELSTAVWVGACMTGPGARQGMGDRLMMMLMLRGLSIR